MSRAKKYTAYLMLLCVAAFFVRSTQLRPRIPRILPVFKEGQTCSYKEEHWTRGRMATIEEASDTRARRILDALGQGVNQHRKQWEFVFIVSSLEKLGMLQPGKRGLDLCRI